MLANIRGVDLGPVRPATLIMSRRDADSSRCLPASADRPGRMDELAATARDHFLPIDDQSLRHLPILQLYDMSFILGLPPGFKHSKPPACGETSVWVRLR